MELTESDVQKLVKPLGVVKKISKLINSLQIQVKLAICMYFFFVFFLKYKQMKDCSGEEV